jgi:hypothetical protein
MIDEMPQASNNGGATATVNGAVLLVVNKHNMHWF